MMRYTTTESGSDLVDLEKEITYISNYIDLQKIRLGNTAKVNYAINGNFENRKIIPLMLIPFIENAFKHGVNADEDSEIMISIDLNDYDLSLNVKNNKVFRISEEFKSGIGIRNTRKRLELLYPTRHLLTIDETSNTYNVILHLNLK
jgi:LytS/YehU family sensor histidine kinase